MAMLDRYKKSGGFLQLLNLIETCGPAKQEKFLGIVFQEDPNWAGAIKKKMLSMERILSWPDETLAEIFSQVQELTLATALFGLGPEVQTRAFKYLSHAQQRRLRDIMDEKKPNPAEVTATYIKIIEEVRRMVKDGYLKLDKLDPALVIEEDIEDKLARGMSFGSDYVPTGAAPGESPDVPHFPEDLPQVDANGVVAPSLAQAEVSTLRKKVELLQKENAQLRHEIKILRTKIETIRKAAA